MPTIEELSNEVATSSSVEVKLPAEAAVLPGEEVRIRGLQSRPELNGMMGVVRSYSKEKGRYAVELADGSKILLKLANLGNPNKVDVHNMAPGGFSNITENRCNVPIPEGGDEDSVDYDTALAGVDFAMLRDKLLRAGSRPGCSSMPGRLLNALPKGRPCLSRIISLLQQSPDELPPVIQQACDALARICTTAASARNVVRRAGAAEALVYAIKHPPTKTMPPVSAEAKGNTTEAAVVTPAAPASEAALAIEAAPATEADALLVSRAVCHALTNLANGDLACKLAVANAQGADVIADAMRRWSDDESLLKICVGGLANIAGGDAACLGHVLRVNGVGLVVKAIKRHAAASAPLCADACLALANFASSKGEGAEAVCDQGGIDALIAVLRAHGTAEAPLVREWAFASFANLASSGSDDIADALVDSSALRIVVSTMRHCGPGEARAMDFAVGIWSHLGRSPERGEACVSAGFVEATVEAMLRIPTAPSSVRFMEEACRGIATLAYNHSADKRTLLEAGALKALQLMIDRYPKEAKVQEMGRALLSEISH
mmetsp:Transcript_5592/g.11702  ORF Transcript_5592/g.11702 Transcript_5592/m.11702 type:complete len:548 (-) Transcript_5592:642-2285(-)